MPAGRKPPDLLVIERSLAGLFDVPLEAVLDRGDGQLFAQARAREERRTFERNLHALMDKLTTDLRGS